MTELPGVVTHNYHPERGPFRNICELPRSEADRVLREIAASSARAIKPNYLERRFATEEWLQSEKQRKLGPTRLVRPIYFFLGDFADGRDASRPLSIVMPLAEFSPDVVTFTYPDSMASVAIARHDRHVHHRKDYHGQVFTLDEIQDVIARHGMPADRWKIEPSMQYDKFVEMQVWDDRPIRRLLGGKLNLKSVC
jgi:hypothetical protein